MSYPPTPVLPWHHLTEIHHVREDIPTKLRRNYNSPAKLLLKHGRSQVCANLRGIRTMNNSHKSRNFKHQDTVQVGSTLRLYIVLVRLTGTVKNFSFDDLDAIKFPRVNPLARVSMIEWQIRNFFTDPRILLHHFTVHYYSSTVSVVKEL